MTIGVIICKALVKDQDLLFRIHVNNFLNLKALYPVLWKMAVFSDIFLV